MGGPEGTSNPTISFVIRLWLEPQETHDPPEWRWHVRHVQGNSGAYFRRLADVLAYVESKVGVPPPA